MNTFGIKSVSTWAVLAALQNNGDMTIKELSGTLGIHRDTVRRATKELTTVDKVVRMSTGNRNEYAFHAYPPVLPQDKDIRELCMIADETGDGRELTAEKWEAVQAIWEDLLPENKRPHEKWRVRIHAKEMLALTGGSTFELYERLEGIKSAPKYIDYPRKYMMDTLSKQEKNTHLRNVQELKYAISA
jgi:DNA-binding Lrp family transcriptional regulator